MPSSPVAGGSLGRTSGARLQSTGSSEAPNAHPLLSSEQQAKNTLARPRSVLGRGLSDQERSSTPTDYGKLAPPTPRSRSGSTASLEGSSSQPNVYQALNYAPRQRPSTASYKASQPVFQSHGSLFSAQSQAQTNVATFDQVDVVASMDPAGASSSSMSSQTATVRLQLQKLKADAQELNVPPSSLGWVFLERLQAATEGEWAAIAELAGAGEATLLLPTEETGSEEPIFTLADAYDHLLLSSAGRPLPDASVSRASNITTLSGLRCTIDNDATAATDSNRSLTFRSFVARPDSVVAQLRVTQSRQAFLLSLPPLPFCTGIAASPSDSMNALCVYRLGPSNGALSLPSPPWSSAHLSRGGIESPGGARSSPSLVTLFGGSGRERKGTRDHEVATSSTDIGATRTIAVDSPSSVTNASTQRTVSVWVIDRPIRREKVIQDLGAAAQGRISSALNGLPDSVVELVCNFVTNFFSSSSPTSAKGSFISRSRQSPAPRSVWEMSEEELSDSVQDLLANVRCALDGVSGRGLQGSDGDAAKSQRDVDEQLELAEKALLEEIYDRTFCPHKSRDAIHDEALSSRIAALNVLGLSLEHLGIQLPSADSKDGSMVDAQQVIEGLDEVVAACGNELQKLQQASCHSPAAKLAILVTAHKLVVDGLGSLPPIKLRKEASDDLTTDHGALANEDSTPAPRTEEIGRTSSTSSADLILPILIYAIVRSNPPCLTSHLLYIQRFHAESLVRGEASYCLVNIQAAVAFLENVEPTALGLQGADQVLGLEPLSPDLPPSSHAKAASTLAVPEGSFSMPVRIRGRLVHEIGELAGVSNKVITGVLGSSMSAFGRMMGASSDTWEKGRAEGPKTLDDIKGLLAGGARLAPSLIRSTSSFALGGGSTSHAREHRNPSNEKENLTQDDADKADTADSSMGDVDGREMPNLSTPAREKPSIGDRLASLPMLGRLSMTSPSPSLTPLPSTSVRESATSDFAPRPPENILRTLSTRSESTDQSLSPTAATYQRANIKTEHVPASLGSPYAPLATPPTAQRPLHVLIGSTGSVASVKIPLIVEELLRYSNVRVQVISTKSSVHFFDRGIIAELSAQCRNSDDGTVSRHQEKYDVFDLAAENKAAVRGLSREVDRPRAHLWTDEDEWSEWGKIGDPILHIELRRWADIVLIAPCSANTLSKLVAGGCDNLLTSFLRALSPSTPTLLFPAMNTLMYMHPLTARHLTFVHEILGYEVIGPIEKKLACGDLGAGAMTEWLDIVQIVVDRYRLTAGGIVEGAVFHTKDSPHSKAA